MKITRKETDDLLAVLENVYDMLCPPAEVAMEQLRARLGSVGAIRTDCLERAHAAKSENLSSELFYRERGYMEEESRLRMAIAAGTQSLDDIDPEMDISCKVFLWYSMVRKMLDPLVDVYKASVRKELQDTRAEYHRIRSAAHESLEQSDRVETQRLFVDASILLEKCQHLEDVCAKINAF